MPTPFLTGVGLLPVEEVCPKGLLLNLPNAPGDRNPLDGGVRLGMPRNGAGIHNNHVVIDMHRKTVYTVS